jgi:hypothetical protein
MERGQQYRVRPTLVEGESFVGFILRVAEVNSYTSAARVLSKSGLGHVARRRKVTAQEGETFDLSLLSKLTGVGTDRLDSIIFKAFEPAAGKRPVIRIFDSVVPEYLVRTDRQKVCVRCLAQVKYVRRVWEYALVTACPIHKVMLIDECPNCKRRLSWNRNKLYVCRCEYDWRKFEQAELGQVDLEVSRMIYERFEIPIPGMECVGPALPNPLKEQSLGMLGSALLLIGPAIQGISDAKGKLLLPSIRNQKLHDITKSAFFVFEDWPNRFYKYLDDLIESNQHGEEAVSQQKAFGNHLYRKLSSGDIPFMTEAYKTYLNERWNRSYVRQCVDFDVAKYLSKKECALILVTRTQTVDKLVDKGILNSIKYTNLQRKVLLIEADSVNSLKREIDLSVDTREACSCLNCTRDQLRLLTKEGLIKPLRGPDVDGYGSLRFRRRDVDGLIDDMRKMIRPPAGKRDDCAIDFLRAVRTLMRSKYNAASFVRAVLDGRIRPCGHEEQRGLQGFLFVPQDVKNLSNGYHRDYRNGMLSAYGAARLIGVSTSTVYRLIEHGHLFAQRRAGRGEGEIVVSKEEVTRFNNAYAKIPMTLSRQLRTSPASIVKAVREIGIIPVISPNDGKQYFFRRADLAAVDIPSLISGRNNKVGKG